MHLTGTKSVRGSCWALEGVWKHHEKIYNSIWKPWCVLVYRCESAHSPDPFSWGDAFPSGQRLPLSSPGRREARPWAATVPSARGRVRRAARHCSSRLFRFAWKVKLAEETLKQEVSLMQFWFNGGEGLCKSQKTGDSFHYLRFGSLTVSRKLRGLIL